VARFPDAVQVPATKRGVPFTVEPGRVGHHKTQTKGGTGSSLYGASGSWPNFTVRADRVEQHYDTEVGGRAFVNASGGVETNSFGVVQIEVVGFSGVTMHGDSARRPRGAREVRPGVFVDPGGHNRSVAGWRARGHFAHSQVPENHHWDTAYTDLEWFVLNQAMTPTATAAVLSSWKVLPMFQPAVPVVDALATPKGDGAWLLSADGAIFTTGAAPYLGGMNTEEMRPHFAGRTAARLEREGDGYRIVATSGEKYVPTR
jgi:hypothetical protein